MSFWLKNRIWKIKSLKFSLEPEVGIGLIPVFYFENGPRTGPKLQDYFFLNYKSFILEGLLQKFGFFAFYFFNSLKSWPKILTVLGYLDY